MKCFVYGIVPRISPFSNCESSLQNVNVYKISTWSEGVIVFNCMKIVNQLNSFIESMICFITVNGNTHCFRKSRGFTFQCLHSMCLSGGAGLHSLLQRKSFSLCCSGAASTWDRGSCKCRDLCVTVQCSLCLGSFLKESFTILDFFELRLGLGGYIHIYAFSEFFLTYFSLL